MTSQGRTLVARVASRLSELSLDVADGSYIGGEDDLIERFGVSRPTLRQAAKIAESERMISVRRGVRGGFYAARPDVSDAIRTINRYLRLQGAELRHMRVFQGATLESARLAAGCTDEDLREHLRELIDRLPEVDDACSMMRLDTEFSEQIAVMSGNPVAVLLTGLAYAFGRDEQGIYLYSEPSHREQMAGCYKAMGEAILAGDSEMAEFFMARRMKVIHGLIDAADPSLFRPMAEL